MNQPRADSIVQHVRTKFAGALRGATVHRGELTLVVARERVLDVLAFLRDDESLRFDFPIDLTAVDYRDHPRREFPERFAVIYHLLSTATEERLRVKAPVPEDDPVCPSAVGLWSLANWTEREVFDMFGIRFDGHPDLRRILMWEEFEHHPLRKDYPLRGLGERDRYTVVKDDFPQAARSRRQEPAARSSAERGPG
ncbi:MAG TPA: NADH-quinone oxidoreductase subunit C [Phycisphaerae bacterium]|nr:NADH-quinone oxidoreductase subunit C [Phycisphaerae bacterium]